MIFKALDPDMPDDEVEQIISEVDEDGSGTVDYEGKMTFVSSFVGLSAVFFNRILQINDRLKRQSASRLNFDHKKNVFFLSNHFFFFFFFYFRLILMKKSPVNLSFISFFFFSD